MLKVNVKDKAIANITVDKTMDEKYDGKILFPEKHQRAMEHFKGRNIVREVEEILKKEKSRSC